jgi:hypothetical protein
MTKAEDAIRRALSPEDLRAYEALGREPSMFAEALGAFQTQNRLIAIGGWVAGFLLFGVAVLAAWRFWQAPDVRGMLLWGGVAMFSLTGLGLIKLWFFMEMHKNAILREMKRLELQVASLVALSAR